MFERKPYIKTINYYANPAQKIDHMDYVYEPNVIKDMGFGAYSCCKLEYFKKSVDVSDLKEIRVWHASNYGIARNTILEFVDKKGRTLLWKQNPNLRDKGREPVIFTLQEGERWTGQVCQELSSGTCINFVPIFTGPEREADMPGCPQQ
jgi:hypothetical protein